MQLQILAVDPDITAVLCDRRLGMGDQPFVAQTQRRVFAVAAGQRRVRSFLQEDSGLVADRVDGGWGIVHRGGIQADGLPFPNKEAFDHGGIERTAGHRPERREHLDQAVARELEIPAREQCALSGRALKKFRDRTIRDTIEKNARAAARKLAAGERLMGPMALFETFGLDTRMLCLTCGAALLYLAREESLTVGGKTYDSPMELLRGINASPALSEQTLSRIERAYRCFAEGGTLESCRSRENQ